MTVGNRTEAEQIEAMAAGEMGDLESLLAIEAGNFGTRAILVDRVEGAYRFVARGESVTTLTPPQRDFEIGLGHALVALEKKSGRVLLADAGEAPGRLIMPEQEEGSGVDAVVATTSMMPPLRVVIAGVIRDLSVESARRAVQGAYTVIQDIIALDEGTQRWGVERGIEAKLEALCQNPPEAIVLVGGTDGGAVSPLLDVARMLAAAASVLDRLRRPIVVFAGNTEARAAIAGLLADEFDFRAVDNVRPRLDLEVRSGVQREVERIYQDMVMERVPHLGALQTGDSALGLAGAPLLSTAYGFELALRFLARQHGLTRGAVGVDVGAASTQVVAVADGQYESVVQSDLGTSFGIEGLLSQVPISEIMRWLPFEISVEEAQARLLTGRLFPLSLPQSQEDLLLEQAAAREALRLMMGELRSRGTLAGASGLLSPVDLIVGTGGVLAHAPSLGQAALMLLDALQPVGLCRLAVDQLSLLPAVGALATLEPLAAAQVLRQDALLELGTVVAPVGTAREGHIALRLRMEYADGGVVKVEVPYGSLEVVPLPTGEVANLELRPARGFDVKCGIKDVIRGRGHGGRTQVRGGALGVIIDARGRPLPMPKPEARPKRMQEWLWGIGG